ncbi:MAG: phosphatase PAP2 family protein [Methylotenera sp.]
MDFLINSRSQPPRFWLLHLALPLIFALFLALIYPKTGLDAQLLSQFYDSQALTFPLKNDSFLENIMHVGLKNLMVLVSLVLLGLWALGLKIWPLKLSFLQTWQLKNSSLYTYHQQFLWVFVAMVISTSTISILKHLSMHACPWDLLIYGGTQPLIPLFGSLPIGATPGHCFPGGHASGGFALLAFYFGFRDSSPKIAKIGLILGVLFGLAMGWAQMMRGAHFMSHNLWTVWLVWMVLLTKYLIWPPKKSSPSV